MNELDRLATAVREAARKQSGAYYRAPRVTTAHVLLADALAEAVAGGSIQGGQVSPDLAWEYDGVALPGDSAPIWTADTTGAPALSLASGVLTIACAPGDKALFTYDDALLDNDQGVTLAMRLDVSGAGDTALLKLEDGAYLFEVGLKDDGAGFDTYWSYLGSYWSSYWSGAGETSFVTIKLVCRGVGAKLYIDGYLVATWGATANDVSANRRVTFGIDTCTVAQTLRVDYLRCYYGG